MTDKNKEMLVTAIITTKDRPDFLSKAVSSVLAQTYRPLELIIVDDGSAIPVVERVFENPGSVAVKIIRNETSNGVSSARNCGVSQANGHFVAFLDDDDQWAAKKIEKQAGFLSEHTGRTMACGCQITVVGQDGAFITNPDRPTKREDIIANLAYSDENITPSTLMFDRHAFQKLGGFREDMPTAEDREFLLRFLLSNDIAVLSERLVNFTEHKGARLTRNSDAMFQGELKYLAFIRMNAKALAIDRRRAVGYRLAKVGHQAMLAGKWWIGLANFTRGLSMYPLDKRIVGGWLLALLGPSIYYQLISLRIERIR